MGTNPFITDKCSAEDAEALIKAGVPQMDASGRVPWDKIEQEAGTKVGYSRGWLVVRRAYVEQNMPTVLVDAEKLFSDAFKKAEKEGKSSEFDKAKVLEPVVVDMRDNKKLSWGEIMVRLGLPEGQVRKAYRSNGIRKDLGLRIGKGGRFAYDDGRLYEDNRKVEGAQIKLDATGKPRVEDLLNYKPKEGATKRQAADGAIKRIIKARKLMNDSATPSAQRVNIKAQIDELMAKYHITEPMISAFIKANPKAA